MSLALSSLLIAESANAEVRRLETDESEPSSWKSEWFPFGKGRLFRNMLAAPLQVNFSVGVRAGDEVVKTNMVDASFGGAFPLVHFRSNRGIELSMATEAGVWFIPWTLPVEDGSRAQEFFSSDFYVGVPLSLRVENWTARFRLYHISFHLGDEATVEHLQEIPRSKTTNAVDAFGAYEFPWGLRAYAGVGATVRTTGHAPGGEAYAALGGELEFAQHSLSYLSTQGAVYVAAYVRTWAANEESLNGTYAVGYMARPDAAEGQSLRAYLEANHGRSWVGRYSDARVRTLGFRLAFDH